MWRRGAGDHSWMWDTAERMMSSSARVTIEPALAEVPETPKRRKYSIAEKRRIVEERFEPGASVARAARAHGVNANQVINGGGCIIAGVWAETCASHNPPNCCQ